MERLFSLSLALSFLRKLSSWSFTQFAVINQEEVLICDRSSAAFPR